MRAALQRRVAVRRLGRATRPRDAFAPCFAADGRDVSVPAFAGSRTFVL